MSSASITAGACVCDKRAVVRLYVCRCVQVVVCTFCDIFPCWPFKKNPLYLLLGHVLYLVVVVLVLGSWGQAGVNAPVVCVLSPSSAFPLLRSLRRCPGVRHSLSSRRHTARKGLKAPGTSRQKWISDFLCSFFSPLSLWVILSFR